MPSGRAALIERMQAMLSGGEAIRIKTLPPEEALVEDIKARHGARLLHAELRAQRLLLVLEAEPAIVAAEQTRLAPRRRGRKSSIAPLGGRCNDSRKPGSSASRKRAPASSMRARRSPRRRRRTNGEARSGRVNA